jgi:hypothetical protein
MIMIDVHVLTVVSRLQCMCMCILFEIYRYLFVCLSKLFIFSNAWANNCSSEQRGRKLLVPHLAQK